jgi:hypothetical protein
VVTRKAHALAGSGGTAWRVKGGWAERLLRNIWLGSFIMLWELADKIWRGSIEGVRDRRFQVARSELDIRGAHMIPETLG